MLANKTIVLGVTGGTAAYKAANLASKLIQAGAAVQVVMTEAATKFLAPLTMCSITNQPVVADMWELASKYNVRHVSLAEAADVVVIAPATANTIAKLAAGIADNMLGCVVLATRAPVIVAYAMYDNMFQNPVTRDNVAKLKARGFSFIGPEDDPLAFPRARMATSEMIIKAIEQVLERK
jgi:phosphopantothenoylcysteine decarboxylase/phosphopantothenate--cysteine ligase